MSRFICLLGVLFAHSLTHSFYQNLITPKFLRLHSTNFISSFFFSLSFCCFSKVHITQQTLELLEDQYFFEPGTEMAKKDPILIKNNIETFLISPQYYYGGDSHVSFYISKCSKRNVFISRRSIHLNPKSKLFTLHCLSFVHSIIVRTS